MEIFSERIILSVTRLTSLINGLLEENFGHIWVEGEISNLSRPYSGHIYFTLKDSGAMIRCVMFKGSARFLKFKPEEGMTLIVKGRLTVYGQRGEYQIVAEYMEPRGIGELQLAFMQLKERLASEGLFDESRKRPLPQFPGRVGVITSPSGAAIHDILNVLGRRMTAVELLLYPVAVQGDGAAAEITKGIEDMNRLRLADILIVGRGGGSVEDLWPFNEECLARAIRRSRIPVVSAVGHETDWTICDFAADLRAATPSAAAEIVSAGSIELEARIEGFFDRLIQAQKIRLGALRGSVEAARRSIHDPTMLLGHMGQRIDDLSERLHLAARNCLARRRELATGYELKLAGLHPAVMISRRKQDVVMLSEKMERKIADMLGGIKLQYGDSVARLNTLSPLNTLLRGYSVAERVKNGSIVRDSASISVGERLLVRFHKGRATCIVEDKTS